MIFAASQPVSPGRAHDAREAAIHNLSPVPAAARRGAMSDRGLRRLFDRLVALGGVRELTGRSTFRLYGL